MDSAIERRNARIALLPDLALLRALGAEEGVRDEGLSDVEFTAFVDMLRDVKAGLSLTPKQREWAEDAARRILPYAAEDTPRGREVLTPEVLKNLPKSPPRRRE
jgi:hypothetical protein